MHKGLDPTRVHHSSCAGASHWSPRLVVRTHVSQLRHATKDALIGAFGHLPIDLQEPLAIRRCFRISNTILASVVLSALPAPCRQVFPPEHGESSIFVLLFLPLGCNTCTRMQRCLSTLIRTPFYFHVVTVLVTTWLPFILLTCLKKIAEWFIT